MSEHKNFLERWSRRKREGGEEPKPLLDADKKDATTGSAPIESPVSTEPASAPTAKPFDVADLPSIESIVADTDVRGFLQPGVPEELKRAALRRAWSSDPAIRDFVGLVESGWDFNDPNAAAGFGSITPQEVARLLSQAVGAVIPDEKIPAASPQVTAAEEKKPLPAARSGSQAAADQDPPQETSPQRGKDDVAPQNNSDV